MPFKAESEGTKLILLERGGHSPMFPPGFAAAGKQ